MIIRPFRIALIGMAALTSMLVAFAQGPSGQQSTGQQASTSVPKVKPNLMPQDKTMHPAPAGGAHQKTQGNSVGKGSLTVTTAQPVDFWQEQVAYSGGDMVTTDFLYNPDRGVVYGYR